MSGENKPCQFCGEKENIKCVYRRQWGEYSICCGNCFSCGPLADTPEKAWEKWNKRSGDK